MLQCQEGKENLLSFYKLGRVKKNSPIRHDQVLMYNKKNVYSGQRSPPPLMNVLRETLTNGQIDVKSAAEFHELHGMILFI